MERKDIHQVYQVPHDDEPDFFVVRQEPIAPDPKVAVRKKIQDRYSKSEINDIFDPHQWVVVEAFVPEDIETDVHFVHSKIVCRNNERSLRACLRTVSRWQNRAIRAMRDVAEDFSKHFESMRERLESHASR